MKPIALAALLVLAACATGAAPARAPSAADIEAAVVVEMAASAAVQAAPGQTFTSDADVDDLSCRPVEDGCFQCSYSVTKRQVSQQRSGGPGIEVMLSEPRADMVCNATGSWTLTPMSQIGS